VENAILERIQIPQLDLVNLRCCNFYTALYCCDANIDMRGISLLISMAMAFTLALTGGLFYKVNLPLRGRSRQ